MQVTGVPGAVICPVESQAFRWQLPNTVISRGPTMTKVALQLSDALEPFTIVTRPPAHAAA